MNVDLSLSLSFAIFLSRCTSVLAVWVRENEICESGREGRVVGRAERGRQQRSAASSTSAKTVSLLFVRNGRSSTLHPHVSSHHRHRLLPRLNEMESVVHPPLTLSVPTLISWHPPVSISLEVPLAPPLALKWLLFRQHSL